MRQVKKQKRKENQILTLLVKRKFLKIKDLGNTRGRTGMEQRSIKRKYTGLGMLQRLRLQKKEEIM